MLEVRCVQEVMCARGRNDVCDRSNICELGHMFALGQMFGIYVYSTLLVNLKIKLQYIDSYLTQKSLQFETDVSNLIFFI